MLISSPAPLATSTRASLSRRALQPVLAAATLSLLAPLPAAQVLAAPAAPLATQWDTRPDTWAAVDGLGRQVPARGEPFAGGQVPAPRRDRFVGMFTFLWLGESGSAGPFDNSRILARDPDAASKPDSPLWGPLYAPHHWGEPLFGYYVCDDEWVLRKHAQMLVDAGVDTVIFDTTNQLTYPRSYFALCRVYRKIRAEGGRTPQIAFLAPFGDPSRVVQALYLSLYHPAGGRPSPYDDLFFRWEGKPLIMADPAGITPDSLGQSDREPQRLEAGSTLGQSFRAARPFTFVGGSFPTWSAKGSGATVSLFDRAGGRLLARRRLENVPDNAMAGIELSAPLPAGSYYLEQSQPRGPIGWWTTSGRASSTGRAYAEGNEVLAERTLAVRYAGEAQNTTLTSAEARPSPEQRASLARDIRSFFTFRKPQPSYFEGPTGPNQWSWLEVFPQHTFYKTPGVPEQMAVGVAQNAVDGRLSMLSNPTAYGRSFHDGKEPLTGQDFTGRNFAEQWGRALSVDPGFVFVTGWNEWIAGRFPREPNPFYAPRAVNFVDEFNEEYSRDIEPMRGGHGDAYYLQLSSYIRRYKGARAPQLASAPRSIQVDGRFGDWAAVGPEFRDDRFDTQHRDHDGWSRKLRLTDPSGRNDFEALKLARDSKYLSAYARTREPISPAGAPGAEWMSLFLNTDANWKTGWRGFDFAINRLPARNRSASVEAWRGGRWQRVGEARLAFKGRELELSVPLSLLSLAQVKEIDFKWSDNTGGQSDALSWYEHGDTAPNGRFAYRFIAPQK